jgi:SAM-dependent methyltransferase
VPLELEERTREVVARLATPALSLIRGLPRLRRVLGEALFLRVLRWSFLPARFQSLGKLGNELAYSFMTFAGMEHLPFRNLGFAGDASASGLRPEDEPFAYCIGIYRELLSFIDPRGADILEVGCGCGGGSSYMARYAAARRVVGIDLSRAEIRVCRGLHGGVPGLSFRHGDAERLARDFAPASFDVVVNVESSHCYPSMDRFLAGVAHVLRPGGHLLWADFRPFPLWTELQARFAASGLRVRAARDVTANVLRALDAHFYDALLRHVGVTDEWLVALMRRWAAQDDGGYASAFRAGAMVYALCVMQRPVD